MRNAQRSANTRPFQRIPVKTQRGTFVLIFSSKGLCAVRFPKIDRRDIPTYYLRVEIRIIAGAKDFDDAIARICHQ